ncbi:hydroxyacid dehydrogenase [Mycolicibacterium flavescens]|uniref:Hydroxyacid dehydrogenase n=1 Tax=Mycolicibacterium flavescens TaxID=1776 RepID=A0A1E3RB81_MYCFV|nr:2-hydroxyacid dehydrogenase [Mycolicibacterium flavescens]MCV7278325.1 hydroxyacid dehydrogenase [Mycolicibacterium flavescens]ODQ87165.1 hydroxyacid dehydrogenase [Mycolicibacterium flavescens]
MKVVIADANLVPHRSRLEAALPDGCAVEWFPGGAPAESLRDATVYVGSRFTAEMAATAEKLRLIHVAGAGTDKIDFAAVSSDVLVANTFHHERSIAEYIVAAAVLLRRDFLAQDRALREGRWATPVYDPAIPQLPTLGDARIGFVGFGHIGRAAWDLFRAFGCSGAAVTGSGRVPECGLDWADDTGSLDRLLRECDVAVVSAPLTEQTTGMIGAEQLRLLGADGVLINVGRGPLVQERGLYDALSGKVIRAAAIDVWYRYPSDGPCAPSELPFAELPNVLMTPHSSGVTRDTFEGRADDIAANIGRLSRGEALTNVVNQRR